MARCIACDNPATVALHAISKEEPKPKPHEGTSHYTELVFACDTHKDQSGALKTALPDPERFEWRLDKMTAPIVACPQCGRERHAAHLWTCPECGRTGCSGCMMRYPVTGTCGECVKPVHDAAAQAAVEEYPDLPGVGDRQQAELANKRAEHAHEVAKRLLAALAAKHGGTG